MTVERRGKGGRTQAGGTSTDNDRVIPGPLTASSAPRADKTYDLKLDAWDTSYDFNSDGAITFIDV